MKGARCNTGASYKPAPEASNKRMEVIKLLNAKQAIDNERRKGKASEANRKIDIELENCGV